jgi:hypothetical protein
MNIQVFSITYIHFHPVSCMEMESLCLPVIAVFFREVPGPCV